MAQKYFDKFPVITYANNKVVDITKRVALLEKVSKNPYVFYPYEITDGERADQLSTRYYKDAYRSWMIYLTNKMIDPYYEWYLSDNEFYDFVDKKYGSYFLAETRVKYYINNWVNGDDVSVETYDSMIGNVKKYFEPVYSDGNVISSYKRKQEDWVINTNRIVAYTVSNTNFVEDEVCIINFNGGQYTGRGQFVSANSNTVFIQHVSGDYIPHDQVTMDGVLYIYGQQSSVNTVFTTANVVSNNISYEEDIYFKPVTYLEYEFERNEFNKSIRVIDSNFKQLAVDNLKDLMQE